MLSALSSVVAIGAVVTVGGPLAVVLVGTAFALTTLALTIPDDVLLQSGISREELNHAVDTAYAALQKAKQVAPEVFQERSEEHTSELQSLMRISYAVFCLKKKKIETTVHHIDHRRHSYCEQEYVTTT